MSTPLDKEPENFSIEQAKATAILPPCADWCTAYVYFHKQKVGEEIRE